MFPCARNYPGPVRDKTQANSAAPGDQLIRAGAIVFFLGAVATLVTVAPLFLGAKPFPTYMYGLSMLMAVGFLVAGAGVLRSITAGRRQARDASASR
ncbi:hypothetical protein SRB17_60860 [Streptomyces sp. RB17]|nr:hypothetical protein [Streptomyces sp. RB17]